MARCMGCMAQIPEEEQVCRYCGYKKGTDVSEAYYLLPGTILRKKYTVGKVLGYGGFGITYIGWDNVLQRKVAIKEYLPSDFATRSYGVRQLTVFSGQATEQFQAGLESFIYEAKRLARFQAVPEIVDIYDCFEENGSGYIVMELLDGSTVKEIIKKKRRLSVAQARVIVLSVLRGLGAVHKEGIIHRDIAPDNIFITRKGKVKILDFGAARYAATAQSKSLSVILKPGFAPEEQYRSHGVQGPWTDIYALGATFYCMITGRRPQESIQRLADDQLKPPSQMGVAIDPNIENAIMNSLNVRQEYRIQDAKSFFYALQGEEEVVRIVEKTDDKVNWKLPLWMKCSIGVACLLICACIGLYATGNIGFTKKEIASTDGSAALSGDQRYVPNVSGMSYEEAQILLKEKDLQLVIKGMNYSDSIQKNKILSQTPGGGAVAEAQETISVIMSGGREEVMMPDLSGMMREEAEKLIAGQNLVVRTSDIRETYSDVVQKGRVISQSIEPEERIAVQTEVSFVISLGSLSEETAVLTVPDLSGLSKEEAVKRLEKLKQETGFTYSIGEVKNKFNREVEKGKIIRQSPQAGSSVRTNEPIRLVISKGPEMVQVPELMYIAQADAQKKLQKAGLQAVVATAYSSQVSEGLVISQSVESGSKAVKGSSVTITVSLGKEPVQQGSGTGNAGSAGGSSGNTGGSGSAGGSGNAGGSSTGGSGNAGGSSTGVGNAGSSAGGSSSGGSGNAGNAGGDGDRALMPDGGSFVVE